MPLKEMQKSSECLWSTIIAHWLIELELEGEGWCGEVIILSEQKGHIVDISSVPMCEEVTELISSSQAPGASFASPGLLNSL